MSLPRFALLRRFETPAFPGLLSCGAIRCRCGNQHLALASSLLLTASNLVRMRQSQDWKAKRAPFCLNLNRV